MKLTRRQTKAPRLKSVIKMHLLSSIAIKNLLSKRLRTFLTMTGIVIGVGAVVFLISLAIGLHGVVDHQVLGSKSVDTIDVTTPNSENIQLNDANINKITQIANVTKVASAYIMPGQISFSNSLSDTVVYGTNNEYITLSALKFVAGAKGFSANDDAIVNTSLLSLIGQSSPSKAINKKLSIQTSITSADGSVTKKVSDNLTIIGVANTGAGAVVYMNAQLLRDAGAVEYGQVKVVAANRSDVTTVRHQIEGFGLTTASPLDTLNQINTIFTIFTFVVAGFGGIGMVIAILGMFNTLTISLLERTSEIGLMITLGARKSDIKRLLILEALILSITGGIVGMFLAWFIGQVINFVLTHFANQNGVAGAIHVFSVTPFLVASVIVLTLAVGFIVVFYPARRAAKINPIDALRHE
jgi:putative ABC transport system permease protein